MARPKDPTLRPRLLQAAARAFAEHGFAAVNMAEIGAAAGVTKGGVYFHFRGKEELFFAVLDDWRGGLRQLLARREDEEGLAIDLRGFLVAYLRFQFAHPEGSSLLRVLGTELKSRFTTRLREDLRETQRAVRSRIRDLLMAGVQRGRLFTSDPALATFFLASSIEGVLGLWHSSPRDAEPFCSPEGLADLMLAGFETGNEGAAGEGDSARVDRGREGVDFLPPLQEPPQQSS